MSNIAFNYQQCQYLLQINNKFQIEIIDYLIRSSYRHKKLFPSQRCILQVLRKKFGKCCLKTVWNHIKKLSQLGIVNKKKRYNTTSVYTLSGVFEQYAPLLRDKFTSLKWAANWKKVKQTVTQRKEALATHFNKFYVSRYYYVIKKNILSLFTRERYEEHPDIRSHKNFKIKFRRRRDMEQVQITPTLQKVTQRLSLSKAGQLKLIQFSDQALEYALQKHTSTTSFNSFFIKAMDYCKDNNLEPDWTYHYQMMEKYKIPKDAKFIRTTSSSPVVFTTQATKTTKFVSKQSFQETATWEDRIREKYEAREAERIIGNRQKFAQYLRTDSNNE